MTADDDDNFDPYRELATYARRLDARRRRGLFAMPFFEIMSGALVWTDERVWRAPPGLVGVLRILWAYRTSLMLNEPRDELAEYWRFGLVKFPHWVGFRPGRRTATPRLLRIYRVGDVSLRKCLRDMDRESALADEAQ